MQAIHAFIKLVWNFKSIFTLIKQTLGNRNAVDIWRKTTTKKQPQSMSATPFNPDAKCKKNMSKQSKTAPAARNLGINSWCSGLWGHQGPRGGLSWGHICTQSSHKHIQKHTGSGGRQQSPCHLWLRFAHVGGATPRTKRSGAQPPWCHPAAMETARELFQLKRANTEISLSKGF